MSAPIEMDYTNRDYDSILTFLVSAAKGFMPEWVGAGEPADFGTLLLEMYAYVGDISNYYIDRCAAEPFLATAQRRQSVLGIAQMLGYTPIAQQCSSGTVTFSLDPSSHTSDSLTIPSGTMVQTLPSESSGAIYFETVGNTFLGLLPSGSVRAADQGIVEGRTIVSEFLVLSNGAPMQEYVLMNAGVIYRSVGLFVQETDQAAVEWSYIDNLTNAGPDASVYTTYLDDQQFTHVVFGDNVSGRIPPTGAQITVNYRYGVGSAGNVAIGTILQVNPPIQGVSVFNNVAATGGSDNESIDQMRYSIPRAIRTKNRAVTLQDFADLSMQVPGVAKATSSGQFYTNVKVYIAPVGGGYPTTDLRASVDTYLTDRSLVGASVEVHPFSTSEWLYQDIQLGIQVHVRKEYGQLTVINAVHDALISLLSFEAMEFGGFISQGDVYHAVLAVPGVDYMVLTSMFPLAQDGVTPIPPTVQDIQAAPTLIPRLLDDTAHLIISAVGGLS